MTLLSRERAKVRTTGSLQCNKMKSVRCGRGLTADWHLFGAIPPIGTICWRKRMQIGGAP